MSNDLIPYDTAHAEAATKILARATPASQKRKRVGPGGIMLDYVPWAYVARRLNEAFGAGHWGFEIGIPPVKDGLTGEVVIGMRLRVGETVQDAIGSHRYQENNPNASYGDAIQSAMSKALRRAAARWGVALDLYAKEEEGEQAAEAARLAFRSLLSTFGMPDSAAISRLCDHYDTEAERFGDIVRVVMERDGCEENEAIWSMIKVLI